MMCFEKDLVNKAIALIDEKSKSDELKAFTDVNDINNMIRNLQINRDYQCDAIKLNQRLREEYPNIEKLLNLGRNNNCDVSVINGAQTISVAAMYYLNLIEKLQDMELSDQDKEKYEAEKKQALEAKVLLRVIKKDSYRNDLKDFFKEISVSLNRQKAINDADIRYTDYLIEDINEISGKREEPFFKIQKRSSNKLKRGEYTIEDFVKITAIFLLQEPGTARSSKGKYLKMDSQWDRFKVSDNEEFNEKIFLKKYKPFVITQKLFYNLTKSMNMSAKKSNNIQLKNIYRYGTEFLTAYIVWVANKKQIGDFSSFPDELNWDEKNVDIIKDEFAKAVIGCFGIEEIDSNLFKKDKAYVQLREYMTTISFLDDLIQKLFISILIA